MRKIGGVENGYAVYHLIKSSNGTAFALSFKDYVLHIINNDGKTVKTVSKDDYEIGDWDDGLDDLVRHLRNFEVKFGKAKEPAYATLPKDLAEGLAIYK